MRVTESELLDAIAKETIIDRDALVRDADLDDLGVSSLDVVTLFFELEERYDVIIEGEDMPEMKKLGDLVDFLLGRINGQRVAL